ncbi:MAG: polysaccharide deacetylase family protein [Planctomycetaceae bacterium]|jgi:peptidoglycan/xylan/chitin deacetylase (PgdA/CDA1 family)
MHRHLLTFLVCLAALPVNALEPIPDRLVVLTFDDSVKSHFTVVRETLQKYGFGATFFITEGFDFKTNKTDYMTWEEITQLHHDGFEIGNHTRDHMSLDEKKPEKLEQLVTQIEAINARCLEHGIPRTTTFAYPGNGIDMAAFPILRQLGIRFARRGGAPEFPYERGRGFAYEPGLDHPLLIPSAGDGRPDWTLDDFKRAIEQARFGRIAVLQFHGAPDTAHSWVNTPEDRFRLYMNYLAEHDFTVIALRDLARYVDSEVMPRDPGFVIEDRQRMIESGASPDNFRRPVGEHELQAWLENMVWYHRYTNAEVRAATGMSDAEVDEALARFNIRDETRPKRGADDPLLIMPYPGGRHPRTGFLDGAVRPQRDTKMSVFAPWNPRDYFVLDIPEAIRRNDESEHGLLYLAHTHVDTMWTKQQIPLQPVEWIRDADGSLVMERRLPNKVVFGTRVVSTRDALHMEMWLNNGSTEELSNLRVQNCIMLKGAAEFAQGDTETIVRSEPYIARRSSESNRWIITAWTPCHHTWFNPPCPCMHSDGRFPDCAPGESRRLRGWLSFYEGDAIEDELARIEATGWHNTAE